MRILEVNSNYTVYTVCYAFPTYLYVTVHWVYSILAVNSYNRKGGGDSSKTAFFLKDCEKTATLPKDF